MTTFPVFIFIMYIIERRYQYRIRGGVKWSDWFTIKRFEDKKEAEEELSRRKKLKEPDKKLLGEYRMGEKKEEEKKEVEEKEKKGRKKKK